ncbi:toll-like receptor 13 [Pantherophis guttatus]|uniref:Toll-like receptor 13 n=1 Tax=Pantherophis guttatus TaxID=94885 RepID=A0A6P9DAC5_PANGU|nr:toll-like receptor 13 [Pantherophis guttatus]
MWLFVFNQVQTVTSYTFNKCEIHNNFGNKTKVLCYNQKLLEIPTYLPTKLVFLDLSQNSIRSLEKNDFKNFIHLQALNISQNNITKIEDGAFIHTSHLEFLNLSANQLQLLSSSMFDGLINLTTLLLASNKIYRIKPSAFASLENLKVIDLSSNKLYTLSAMHAVFNMGSLRKLHIKDNGLQNLSTKEIINASPLIELDASHNPISLINITTPVLQRLFSLDLSFAIANDSILWEIEDSCFLEGLKALYLGGIAMKPSEISKVIQMLNCSQLEIIHLNQLNITESDNLIEKICQWHQQVQILNFQGNKFTSIKEGAFENCTHLKFLNMSFNQLKRLPMASFQSLNLLHSISWTNNISTLVPIMTPNVSLLESLDLSFNEISKITSDDFKYLNNLKAFYITGNQIAFVSSHDFDHLNNLQELNLAQNFLRTITQPFSGSLTKLEVLVLRQNDLETIEKGVFKNLSSLRFLNLADNRIDTIVPGTFEGLSNLQILILGQNRIGKKPFRGDFFQGASSLADLDLFNNYISYESSEMLASPPFKLLKSLKNLKINSQGGNGLKYFPVNFLDGLESIVQLHAGNLAISSLEPETFTFTPTLQELDLSNNELSSLSNTLFHPISKLKELHLKRNRLNSLNFFLNANLSRLTLFRATGNVIGVITEEQLSTLPSLLFLDLRQNYFICTCSNQMFMQWSLQNPKTQVLHFYQYTCTFPQGHKSYPLWTFNTSSCFIDYEFILFIVNTTAVLSLMLACFFYQWKLHIIYMFHLLLAYYIDKKQKRKGQGTGYSYDAFLSYNTHDEKWVEDDLLPVLENQYSWKVCLHHRDFEPGRSILENIVDNIYASRKTICIISRHYLESEWCSKEIQVASFRIFDDHKDVLVLIFLEDIPTEYLSPYHRMRKLLKTKTYLKWPEDEQEIPLFWHKLNMAMKTGDGKEDENPVLAGFVPDEIP